MKEKYTEEKSNKTIEFPVDAKAADEAANAGKKTVYRRITIGSLLAVIFMILYVPSLLNWLSGNHIAQDVIRIGTIEEYVTAEAVIIREEELLAPSSIDGRYIPEINEGEKTAAYTNVAVVTGEESDAKLKEIEELNARIVKARMEQAEKADFFSEDLAKLDDEIGHMVQELIFACNSRSFEEMGKQRKEIGKIVEKKAEIVAGNSTDEYISSLQKKKKALQKEIDQNTLQVRSSFSGIVSYKVDGFEKVLTPDRLTDLTMDELEKIRADHAAVPASSGSVKEGSSFAKIIKGVDIWLAADIPAEKARNLKEGSSIRIRINTRDFETAGVIAHIKETGTDKCIIVVKMNRGTDVLSDLRVVSADFITKTEEGLKVPLKCLRDITQDGSRGRIMLVRYNVAASRIVDILCSDNEYAIIRTPENEYKRTVNLYDIYIVNPDNIEEGDIINK